MLSGNENRPAGKSDSKRKAEEGKKPGPRKRKATPQQVPQPNQLQQIPEMISTPVTSTASSSTDAFPSNGSRVVPVASGEATPVSYRTIANAYRNCSIRTDPFSSNSGSCGRLTRPLSFRSNSESRFTTASLPSR